MRCGVLKSLSAASFFFPGDQQFQKGARKIAQFAFSNAWDFRKLGLVGGLSGSEVAEGNVRKNDVWGDITLFGERPSKSAQLRKEELIAHNIPLDGGAAGTGLGGGRGAGEG